MENSAEIRPANFVGKEVVLLVGGASGCMQIGFEWIFWDSVGVRFDNSCDFGGNLLLVVDAVGVGTLLCGRVHLVWFRIEFISSLKIVLLLYVNS